MSRTRTIHLALVGALALTLAACGSTAPSEGSQAGQPSAVLPAPVTSPVEDMLTFHDREGGFAISYPADWKLREDVAGTVVAFLAPGGGEASFVDNANVAQERIGSTSLDDYDATARSQILEAFPNAVFVDESTTTMGGEPAYRYEYTSAQGDAEIHLMQTFSMRGDLITAVTFAASQDRWAAQEPAFQAMSSSFNYD